MSIFNPPKFTLASGIESEIEWIYHNQAPRAIIAIRTPEDPPLKVEPKLKTDEGEELAVVTWIDAMPDPAGQKKLLKEALGFLEQFVEEADEDDEE